MASALACGGCIDDADAQRAGGTEQVLARAVRAPSTLGTLLCGRNRLHSFREFTSAPDAVVISLIVRKVKPTSRTQLALFITYSYHAFITDRNGATLNLEADYRRHAEIEWAIRDRKYGVGLNPPMADPQDAPTPTLPGWPSRSSAISSASAPRQPVPRLFIPRPTSADVSLRWIRAWAPVFSAVPWTLQIRLINSEKLPVTAFC